jgi:DNA-binding MarR family transcriptional regulator
VSVDHAYKRSRRLTLTPAGHALLVAALPAWEEQHAEVEGLLEDLGPDRLRRSARALLTAISGVRNSQFYKACAAAS